MTDITDLAEELYKNARAKGFYDHEDSLRKQVAESDEVARKMGASPDLMAKYLKTQLAEHFGNRFMLIAGEAVEAHEEVRSGRGVAELYFSEPGAAGNTSEHPYEAGDERMWKPEGVLPELADIAIRALETMTSILQLASDEEKAKLRAQVPQNEATELRSGSEGVIVEDVNAAEVIILKHEYNTQRAHMNGGRKF